MNFIRYITHAKELEGVSSSLIKIDVKNINNCSRVSVFFAKNLKLQLCDSSIMKESHTEIESDRH